MRWSATMRSEATRQSFRQRIIDNAMNDTEVEIDVTERPACRWIFPAWAAMSA